VQSPVAVEEVQFPLKQPKFGGYKMPRKLRKSFVELPNAILFLRISRERVFQQPRLLTTSVILYGTVELARIGRKGEEI
jgi:hypothetical protein